MARDFIQLDQAHIQANEIAGAILDDDPGNEWKE
jgi:hypothetical protein